MRKKAVWVFVFLALLLCFSSAQDRRELLSSDVLEKIAGEISGKMPFEHIRDLGVFSRYYGSDDQEKAAEYILAKATQYGLTAPHIERFRVDADTYYGMQRPYPAWNCTSGELRMVKPFRELITSYEAINTCVLAYSRDADVEAEVINVGRGTEPQDYTGKDVRGKIVLALGSPWEVSKIAIFEKGAAGVLAGRGMAGMPDLVGQTRIRPWNNDRTKLSTFGFSLSANQTRTILDLLSRGEKVVLQAKVKAEVRLPGYHYGVIATLPGVTYPDEEIIFTAHLDHPRPGAHDDNSGCALLLEVARAMKVLVEKKIIQPPKRTLRFYWTPHVWGADMLFSAYPELLKKTVANINVDCVGINQTKVSSAFTVVMPPHSRASFLNDIFRSFLNLLIIANNDQWTRIKVGPELKDQDGSANVFYGRTIPFLGFSDHVFFNSGSVGIPAVMLIDLPFVAHHSQKDELDLLDPTELKRIGFLAAVVAYTVAIAGPEEAPRIIDEIYHRGRIRLETEMKLAKSVLAGANRDNAPDLYKSAENLVAYGFRREYQALASATLFSKGQKEASSYLSRIIRQLHAFEKECRSDLLGAYQWTCAKFGLQVRPSALTEEEAALGKIIPKPNPALKGTFGILNEYPGDKYTLKDFTPSIPFYYELLNFMDGRRTMLDVLNAVRAEALSSNFQAFSQNEAVAFLKALKEADIISY